MADYLTLREAIDDAIGEHCTRNGFGIPNGFVYCVSRIDSDGRNCLTLGEMEGQTTALSMGLTSYLAKSFDFAAEQELSAFAFAPDDDEDD